MPTEYNSILEPKSAGCAWIFESKVAEHQLMGVFSEKWKLSTTLSSASATKNNGFQAKLKQKAPSQLQIL
ncbi:MAG: hypothetical protein DLM72_19425 [Candidatus Nitrosopolaris wilkensis]|nr:MAG: hypothetical protein DLM72_19425 [Candidatus Nitrosopolaris wilkensis]